MQIRVNRWITEMTDDQSRLLARIHEVTGWNVSGKIGIFTDTSDWTRISRGDIIRLDGRDFVIKGNEYETRFGISDQPKYWVFGAYELESGERKIIKTVFHEDFHVHIGLFKIHCYRSPEKEAAVLDLVRGDFRFMQGYTALDEKQNHVRVIDYIKGPSFLQYAHEIPKPHERYVSEDLPRILWKLADCLRAIQFLHQNGLCHGDIRNDHIKVESGTGNYRWIDFDLNQNVSDFDVWSIGNIINYAVGKGITTFQHTLKSPKFSDKVKSSLTREDASGFFEYRIMNLGKLYPYISQRLNDILLHFTINPAKNYSNMDQLCDDYQAMLALDFPMGGN